LDNLHYTKHLYQCLYTSSFYRIHIVHKTSAGLLYLFGTFGTLDKLPPLLKYTRSVIYQIARSIIITNTVFHVPGVVLVSQRYQLPYQVVYGNAGAEHLSNERPVGQSMHFCGRGFRQNPDFTRCQSVKQNTALVLSSDLSSPSRINMMNFSNYRTKNATFYLCPKWGFLNAVVGEQRDCDFWRPVSATG
jgi:hypothetical protein